MNITMIHLETYFKYCKDQKKLNDKTLKSYRIDLIQFYEFCDQRAISTDILNSFIQVLHERYKPNSVKRKIASLHAFFQFLILSDHLDLNPMVKVQTVFRHAKELPRTISLDHLEPFFKVLYKEQKDAETAYEKFRATRDIAVFELLLGTGLRVSELCHLHYHDIDFREQYVRIMGKGNKERILQIGNAALFEALITYKRYRDQIKTSHDCFFINRYHNRLSEQSVRNRIFDLCEKSNIQEHLTPHMFRHTFATLLLEEDIDIRYIQHILGHSSITTTQIYTHIRSRKQAEILNQKNPRNFVKV